MGKQNVPIKARKAGGGGAPQKHTPSSGGRKHGGIGATNAFDNLVYRSKHEVLQLGKPKGKLKRPAASLSASLAARQQSLLAEFGAREKANSFVDERLEEHNSALDHEDKLLLRFQKERQKRLQAGGGKFALDDAEDTMQLTHQGQALSLGGPKRQRAEGEEEEDNDEDEAAQERRLASSRAQGEEDEDGQDGEDNDGSGPTKSRHEVMSEVMLKSKMYRAERAVLAGEQQDLMGNLDTEFDLVRGQMQWASREDREAAKKAHRAAEVQAEATGAAKKKGGDKSAPEGGADGLHADGDVVFMDAQLDPTDEFVLEAKQLGLDVRAKASDRLKSDEEIIAQEKRRLEKLERQRLKRMRGEVEGGADEIDDDEPKSKRRRERKEAKEASRAAAVRKALPRTDDDLESNVKLTSSAVGGRAADQVDEHELLSDDEAGSGSDESDEDDSDEDDDSDDSDDEEEDEAVAEPADDDDAPIKAVFIGSKPAPAAAAAAEKKPSGPKEIFIGKDGKSSVSSALLAITAKLAGKAAPASADGAAVAADGDAPSNKSAVAAATLPFTFPAPSTYKEFKTLLSQYPSSQHSTIIARIRTCNHISLLPSNAQKMEKFYAILLTHFRRLAADYARLPAAEKSEEGVAALVARMDEIAQHVVELTELQSMNGCVGRSFRAQLSKMRDGMEGAAAAAAAFQTDELLLLKLVASLFPTSDFRHNVTTPTLLLLAEWLNRLPVAGASDLVRGFFAVSLVLHAVNASKRLVPEVLTFLHAALLHGLGIARSEDEKAPVAAAPAAAAAAPATAAAAGKKGKKGAATSANGATIGSASTPAETGAPATGSVGEVFSATPSALRLHSSLQPRNCNFIPSAQLAIWAPMIKQSASAGAAATAKKGGKKDAPAAQQQDLHIPLHWLFHDNSAAVFDPTGPSASSLCATTYSTALQLVHQAAQLWQASSPCYGELFTPILDTLGHVLSQQKAGAFSALPPTLQTYTQHLHSYLSSSIAHSISLRVPLEASLAPLALKSHAPLFTEGYNPTKDYDPIKERAQIKELAQKLKREKKGALRELRRDTAVVVQQQRAVQQAHAAEREAKRKEVWSQMEEQQRDTNILQKASKKAQDKKDSKKSKKK